MKKFNNFNSFIIKTDSLMEDKDCYIEESSIVSQFLETEKEENEELIREIGDVFSDIPISTLVSSDNDDEQKCVIIGNQKNSNKLSEKIQFIEKRKHRFAIESFYNDIEEFHGIIESINTTEKKFNAVLTDVNNTDRTINVEFNLEEIQYESDKPLLQIGAQIVWIIGQETKILFCNGEIKNGPRTNISKCTIRRTKSLTAREKEKADDEADKWTEFFRECSVED